MSEQLEKEVQRCFEAEELAARYKDELDTLRQGQQPDGALHERLRQLEDAVQSREAEVARLKVNARCIFHQTFKQLDHANRPFVLFCPLS